MSRLSALPSPINDMVARGAALSIPHRFDWQSYLDTALLQNAILPSQITQNRILIPPGQKAINDQTHGVGFALHPSSECPVAVMPHQSRGGSNNAAVVLKPGQIYYPGGEFAGFDWGLPYGWLGGGLAQLIVLCERTSDLFWTNDPEMLFHRQTMPVHETTDVIAALSPNWPLRFPWPNAVGSGLVSQGDQPTLVVQPTKTILRLRKASIPANTTLRLVWSSTQDFDYTGGTTPVTVPATTAGAFLDTGWQLFSQSGLDRPLHRGQRLSLIHI